MDSLFVCWLWVVVRRWKCLFYALHFNYAFIILPQGLSTQIRHLSLRSLLPNTDQFMTYEGSTTHPGCWESTVWIILNKPIYITKQEVIQVRTLSKYISWRCNFVANVVDFRVDSSTLWGVSCKDQNRRLKRRSEIMLGHCNRCIIERLELT